MVFHETLTRQSERLYPTFRSKSSDPAFFSHSPRYIRVPRQVDKVSRGSSRRARRVTGEERQSFALFAPSRLRVRLAITPTHSHHMVNRSTRSLFQDGIVLLRKWAIRMKTADIAGNPRAASSPTSCTRRGLIGHLDILNDKRNWIRENNRRAFRHCQKNWPESAGENFRGFIPLLRLPLRPGTGASRFFFWNPRCCSTVVHTPADPAGRNL
jgi:hypothetical protein